MRFKESRTEYEEMFTQIMRNFIENGENTVHKINTKREIFCRFIENVENTVHKISTKRENNSILKPIAKFVEKV